MTTPTSPKPKKRLYTVSVEFELAVYAEDESHARRQACATASDEFYPNNAIISVSPTVLKTPENLVDVLPPHGWDKDCLVYGTTHEDMTLAEAIERERAALLSDGGEP